MISIKRYLKQGVGFFLLASVLVIGVYLFIQYLLLVEPPTDTTATPSSEVNS